MQTLNKKLLLHTCILNYILSSLLRLSFILHSARLEQLLQEVLDYQLFINGQKSLNSFVGYLFTVLDLKHHLLLKKRPC